MVACLGSMPREDGTGGFSGERGGRARMKETAGGFLGKGIDRFLNPSTSIDSMRAIQRYSSNSCSRSAPGCG